jgi:hypothetical protein
MRFIAFIHVNCVFRTKFSDWHFFNMIHYPINVRKGTVLGF